MNYTVDSVLHQRLVTERWQAVVILRVGTPVVQVSSERQ